MINVTKSYLPLLTKYQIYLEKIYQSSWLTNNGECLQELTRRLEKHLNVKNLLLTTNATLALQIAYHALGLTGEVITSPFSFVATTSSLIWEGLTPTFVDIDSKTLCIDVEKISAAITPKTSAILPVHVYGTLCDVEKIQTIANKNHLKVIYDAAHAFGVNYQGRSALDYGDIAILSFHATKLFHSIEGGALIIKDNLVYKKVKEMINFGFDAEGSGEIIGLGINAKMSEFHAAMGLCVLDDIDFICEQRKKIDHYYRTHLPKTLQFIEQNSNATMNYGYFPVVFPSENQLLSAMSSLKKNNIIPRRYFYPSLNTLPYVNYVTMPISEDIAKRVLCLPIYAELSNEQTMQICQIIHRNL